MYDWHRKIMRLIDVVGAFYKTVLRLVQLSATCLDVTIVRFVRRNGCVVCISSICIKLGAIPNSICMPHIC
ncbi:hypothetical protein Sarmat_00686 [Rickettsiales endosymbiont of Paramecium tredecaurelia]|nr:hypothetical protein [Candidatus Sarmatiella mevalonica]